MATTTYPEKKKKNFQIGENFFLYILSLPQLFVLNVFFFFRKLRTVMINWKRYFNLCCSNTVNRGRPILLITRMITDRNGVHLVLLPLCLTEVHPLFFHTKLCAFFHDLIKSLSLYIHRRPQRPQIARALRTRAILVLFNNWSKCFISR